MISFARQIVAIAICIMVSSCTTELETFVVDTPVAKGWVDWVEIEIDNQDSLSLHNISIFIREREINQQTSFNIEVTTTTPDSISHTDLITITTQQHAESKVNEIEYRKSTRWSRLGGYTIRFTPQQPIDGVEAIGIKRVKL